MCDAMLACQIAEDYSLSDSYGNSEAGRARFQVLPPTNVPPSLFPFAALQLP